MFVIFMMMCFAKHEKNEFRTISKRYKDHTGLKTTLRVVNNHVFDNVDISKYGYTNSPKNFVKKLRNTNILYIGPDEGPWQKRKKIHINQIIYLGLIIHS